MAKISFDASLIDVPKARKPRTVRPSAVEQSDLNNPEPTLLGIAEAATPKRTGRQSSDIKTIQQGLTQVFGMAGMGVSLWNTYDGLTIGMNAEKLAEVWTKVAENNAEVRKWLLRVLKGGDMAAAVMATLGVGVAIAANHDVVDERLAEFTKPLGIRTPSKEATAFIGANSNGSDTTP